MEQESTGPIEYAPAEQPFRRRARRWILSGILGLVAVSACLWGPGVWFRTRVLYWQMRIAGHEAPADTVVVRDRPRWKDRTQEPGAGIPPATRPTGRRTAVVPGAWSTFYGMVSPPGLQSRGTAFLHARRAPGDKKVLVAVDFVGHSPDVLAYSGGPRWNAMTPFLVLQFHVRRFTPGNALNLPRQIEDRAVSVYLPAYLLGSIEGEVRLHAGQPDLADPTHFAIAFDAGDHAGVIDGWVREYHTDLELRPSPTPPPPPSPG